MTETDELVAMLNERGVEHDETFEDGADYIWWSDGERDLFARSYHGGLAVYGLSARHAIEATLGSGTCHLKPWEMERDTGFYDCMECDCGHVADVADWAEWSYCPNCGRRIVEVTR